jgi:hypothetical protein
MGSAEMPTSPAWLSSNDPAFPPQLGQYLGDKAPTRMCTIGDLNILKTSQLL